jgi:hypothetical protein
VAFCVLEGVALFHEIIELAAGLSGESVAGARVCEELLGGLAGGFDVKHAFDEAARDGGDLDAEVFGGEGFEPSG